jgi:hypothetical protein
MMGRLRVWLAVVLAHVVERLIAGGDDRVVILNTQRRRSRYGPRTGRVNAFLTERSSGEPITFAPTDAPSDLGVPVSLHVARLAGKKPVTLHGDRAA